MDMIWIAEGNYILLYMLTLIFFFFFTNDHIEGYVEKDPEGSLRKSGIIHKQCLLKKSRKEAVLCIVSICHSSPILPILSREKSF